MFFPANPNRPSKAATKLKVTDSVRCRSEFIDAEMDDYMNGIPDKQLSVDPEERNGHLPGHH